MLFWMPDFWTTFALSLLAVRNVGAFAFTSGQRRSQFVPCTIKKSTSVQAQQLGTFEVLEEKIDKWVAVKREVVLYDFACSEIRYNAAWDFQKYLMEPMIDENHPKASDLDSAGTPGALVLLQHRPVYTLGTASDENYIKLDFDKIEERGIDLVQIERGGEVTFHGPGQLVAYPILNLKRDYKPDIHWYMRALEEVVILSLEKVGIDNAYREDDLTGVWINGKKVAAFGVKVKRWISMHGLAVNVLEQSTEENTFDNIVPCGIEGREVGYINEFLSEGSRIDIPTFSLKLREAFEEIFRFDTFPVDVTAKDFDLLD